MAVYFSMHSYAGIVTRGQGRAGSLGYPTVNIPLGDPSLSGIYSARVKVGDREYIAAVFADTQRKLLEAHLLNFLGELYGKSVTIELCEKIRDSKKFGNDEALRSMIAKDIVKVRDYFKNV